MFRLRRVVLAAVVGHSQAGVEGDVDLLVAAQVQQHLHPGDELLLQLLRVLPEEHLEVATDILAGDTGKHVVVARRRVVPQVAIGQEEGLAVVLLVPGPLGQPGQTLLPLLVGFEPGDDVHERPTRPDGGQLVRVADQDQAANLVQIERPEQHPEQVHRDHRRLVDDDGRGAILFASLELEGEVLGVEPLVAHQELVDREGVPHRVVRPLRPLHEPDTGLAGGCQQQDRSLALELLPARSGRPSAPRSCRCPPDR